MCAYYFEWFLLYHPKAYSKRKQVCKLVRVEVIGEYMLVVNQ